MCFQPMVILTIHCIRFRRKKIMFMVAGNCKAAIVCNRKKGGVERSTDRTSAESVSKRNHEQESK